MSQAYELSKSQPRQVSWCGTKRNSPGILQFLNGRTFLQPASSAAQKYTPPTVSSSSPNSANASGSVTRPAGRPVSGSSSPAGTLTSGSGSPTGSLRQNSQLLDYILFSAQGPQRTLAPGQLIVKPDATDGAVLKSLRTRYRYCRGWLRYYFSVWSVDNCHIVRVGHIKSLDHVCAITDSLRSFIDIRLSVCLENARICLMSWSINTRLARASQKLRIRPFQARCLAFSFTPARSLATGSFDCFMTASHLRAGSITCLAYLRERALSTTIKVRQYGAWKLSSYDLLSVPSFITA